MKGLKVATLCSLIIALVFFTSSVIFYFGDWKRALFMSGLGCCIGLIAAPEIEPKAFKAAWSFQLLSGAISGGLICWLLHLDSIYTVIGIVAGGLLGWAAPFWLKYISIP